MKSKKEITETIEEVIENVKSLDNADPFLSLLTILCSSVASLTMVVIDIRDILGEKDD